MTMATGAKVSSPDSPPGLSTAGMNAPIRSGGGLQGLRILPPRLGKKYISAWTLGSAAHAPWCQPPPDQ